MVDRRRRIGYSVLPKVGCSLQMRAARSSECNFSEVHGNNVTIFHQFPPGRWWVHYKVLKFMMIATSRWQKNNITYHKHTRASRTGHIHWRANETFLFHNKFWLITVKIVVFFVMLFLLLSIFLIFFCVCFFAGRVNMMCVCVSDLAHRRETSNKPKN